MATYYRWDKYDSEYVDKIIGTQEISDSKPLEMRSTSPVYLAEVGLFNSYKVDDTFGWYESDDLSWYMPDSIETESEVIEQLSYKYFSSKPITAFSKACSAFYEPIGVSSVDIIWEKGSYDLISVYMRPVSGTITVKEHSVKQVKGSTNYGYVYSTNASAYPNGGASGNHYWYDQRTTLTSPTTPSNISAPNPIITPNITVSWGAATSNVPDYPVNLYELSYSVNGGSSWTVAGTTAGTSLEVNIPAGTTSILFRVRARDSNGQWGSYSTSSTAIPVYLTPTLTVPQMLMQGQQASVHWTSIEGADSYTLERKANTDTDWVQVYSGANTTFSETVGTWSTVQYRVQAVFSDTPGGWAESSAIPVVSSSALVISGTDSDLGTVVNDIPYSISSDTGNQITATVKVNGALIFSGNVGNSTADVIPVLDLVSGEGTIIIEASVQASSGTVKATRTWTYTKTPITFPDAGSVAQVTKEGENIFPITLANCVRLPGGNTLDQAMGFPCQIYTGDIYGIKNGDELIFPFTPKTLLVFYLGYLGLFVRGTENMYFSNSSSGCTLEWNENSVRFVRSPFKDNITYTYICLG